MFLFKAPHIQKFALSIERVFFITSKEEELLTLHRQLNDEGQEKLLSYADDLVSSGKYIKSDPLGLVAE